MVYDVIIVGGGLAGLINAIQLSKAGFKVLLIEKKSYPFHKVCGEYVSNEVVTFLKSIDAYPTLHDIPIISRFQISSVNGASAMLKLPLGGFGISRYMFDQFLFQKASASGTEFQLNSIVQDIQFNDNIFTVSTRDGKEFQSVLVVGAYGKRTAIDKKLSRKFFFKSSPYIGVKYHIKADFPRDLVALHNFKGGYCGIVAIEEGNINLCYLSRRENLKNLGNIKAMEEGILYMNPFLRKIFTSCEFISEKPEVINEISFAPKKAVENHIFMSGDSAGLISPLCGNGMAMAIHSAKILSQLIIENLKPDQHMFDREALELSYSRIWKQNFSSRLWIGRRIQSLFGTTLSSTALVKISKQFPGFSTRIIELTHGKPF